MRNVIILFFLLVFSLSVFSQELPSNFEFKRETGQETGIPFFHIVPSTESVAYDAGLGNTFEALGVIAQPERDKYGVMLMNAKPTYQLSTGKNKSCTLIIDEEKFEYPRFTLGAKNIVGKLRIETVAFQIDRNTFEKLAKGDDITIRCGIVSYNLDQDNIDALRYLANEIEKDLARRKKVIK